MTDTPTTSLPLFPLGSVLFPGAQMPLHLFEERYRTMMRERRGEDPIFGVVLTESGQEVGDEAATHEVGTAARLLASNEFEDGRWAILVEGTRRFRIVDASWAHGYLIANVEWLEEHEGALERSPAAAAANLIDAFVGYLAALGADLAADLSVVDIEAGLKTAFREDLDGLIYLVGAQMPLNTWHRQRLLELPSVAERYAHVRDLLRQERTILERAGATTSLTTHPTMTILPN